MVSVRRAWPLAVLLLAGCGEDEAPPPVPRLTLAPVAVAELPGWSLDDHGEALPAWRRSCTRLDAQPEDRALGPEGIGGIVAAWRPVCAAVAALADGGGLKAIVEREMAAYRVDGGAEGVFTGYYEPELTGARQQGGAYQVPLYRVPPDHVSVDLGNFDPELKGRRIVGRIEGGRLEPYYPRRAIDGGALAGRGAELLWLDDALDAFVLSVQGSGRVRLPDGSWVRVGFAGHNGHKYNSVGRALIERGELEPGQATWGGIRAWLMANPERAAEIFAVNARYIFYRELEGDGPVGAIGVTLTPGRSLAVDPAFVPLGVPLWLDAEHPLPNAGRLQRLMLAQDTGGAIKGPVRGDVFWGTGEAALRIAGRMKSRGTYYLLLPKSVVPPQFVAELPAEGG